MIDPASHLPLIRHIARRYASPADDVFGDLVSEGFLGLHRAAEKFDPERYDAKFSTYAVWWIRCYIMRFLRRTRSVVRRREGHDIPEDFSVDFKLESGSTPVEMLAEERPLADELLEKFERDEEIRQAMERVRKRLNPMELKVLELRLLADRPATLAAIGRQTERSREAVRLAELRLERFLWNYLREFKEEHPHENG